MALDEIIPDSEGVIVGSRLLLILTVPVKLSARLAVTVAELEGVLVPLPDALDVGVTVSVAV